MKEVNGKNRASIYIRSRWIEEAIRSGSSLSVAPFGSGVLQLHARGRVVIFFISIPDLARTLTCAISFACLVFRPRYQPTRR